MRFSCNQQVIDTIKCMFLENPATGNTHTCYDLADPARKCSGTTGCTFQTSGNPGRIKQFGSDCQGNVTTVMTNEVKNIPFFCMFW